MENILISLIGQSPVAAAMIVVVAMMLKHYERNSASWQQAHRDQQQHWARILSEQQSEWRNIVTKINADCLEARTNSRVVITDNTKALTANTRATEEAIETIRHLQGALPPKTT